MSLKNPLENLIIVAIFSNGKIVETPNGKAVIFSIESRKTDILKNYIIKYKLEPYLSFDNANLKWTIKPSIISERLLRDWTLSGKLTAINPNKVNVNTFILWICLFGRKTERNVVLDINMSDSLQETIVEVFNRLFHGKLYRTQTFFYIKPFHFIMLKAIETKKMIPEIAELNYLLPNNERKEFIKKLKNNNEGILMGND